MSPKWATEVQEEFLEVWYKDYLQIKSQGSKVAFKDFWRNLKAEWKRVFGWSAENDVDEKGAPCLEKVSRADVMRKREETDQVCRGSTNGTIIEGSMGSGNMEWTGNA